MTPIIYFLGLLTSVSAFASGGFTWLSLVQHKTHIPENVLGFLVVILLLVVAGFFYTRAVNRADNVVIPDKGVTLRNIIELIGEFIYGQCKSILGEKAAPKYFPYAMILFITILTSNLMGLIPGVLPPTEHLSTTFALGLFSFIFYNIIGIRAQGFVNYMKHFAGPVWYMAFLIFPLEILSNCIRPLSLALRLRGNMFGDHLVLSVFTGLVPYLVPIVFYLLGLLVSIVQAYVFTLLSIVYISLVHESHDHGAHESSHH